VLCVNPDCFAPEGAPPRPVVRQGTIAQLFGEQGADVYLMGKPSALIYQTALRRLPATLARERILMIGDNPETDIRGAHNAGLSAALVIRTGILANLLQSEGCVSVLSRLPSNDQPDLLLERLSLTKQ